MRVALCLHGLVGNIKTKSGDSNVGSDAVLKLSYKHWNKYILRKNNPDIFIHTWNADLKNDIHNYFNPKIIVAEEQVKFKIPEWIPGGEQRKQNHYSKWYSNLQSVNLMERYSQKNNIKYDIVMIARFDIAWKKPINMHELDNSKFYIGGWHRRPVNKVKDFWFIGSQKNILKFSSLYQNIEKYCAEKVVSKSNGISNHKMAAKHILNCGFKTEQLLSCEDDFDASKSDYPLIRYQYFGAEK